MVERQAPGVLVVKHELCDLVTRHSNILGFRFCIKNVESFKCPDEVAVKVIFCIILVPNVFYYYK